MANRHRSRRSRNANREQGQIVVLFALCLVAILAMAGLLIDGGSAWANRRGAQSAADSAALAAAKAAVATHDYRAAGQAVAALNGFPAGGKDCTGNDLVDQLGNHTGVSVYRPPVDGPHVGNDSFVEVITTRKMSTTFAGVVGQTCWMVSARAVASIGNSSVAQCSFCSLDKNDDNHTLLIKG
ncbi:MAG: pilus assembly protein TadG-related protein, partial [bacterium]